MSDLVPLNKNALSVSSVEDVAMGPRVGFMESWKTSWEAQERASAQFGIENSMWELDDQQYRAMKDAGIEDAPKLSPSSVGFFASWMPGPAKDVDKYLDTAKFYADGGDEAQSTRLGEYDKKIEDLRQRYPNLNLMTSRDMFNDVRTKAQEVERQLNTNRTTFMGVVGEFAGGAVASMNPNTDPLNFATLGVGGIGKTAVTRIASQVGAQGVIETINQVTGVQEERRILGLDHGFWDGATRVAGTAIGAGVLQGVGEGLVAGGKRFFRNTKTDPAPGPPVEQPKLLEYKPKEGDANVNAPNRPPSYDSTIQRVSPLSTSRAGQARTTLDVDYMASRLESWDAELPYAVRPRSETAIPKPVTDFQAPDIKIKENITSDIDIRAREVDPKLFSQYDRLAERKQSFRRWIEEMGQGRPKQDEAFQKLQTRIDELEDRIDSPKTSARNRKRYEQELEQALLTREDELKRVTAKDTPEMARVRKELMDTDIKMRDLAPSVGRAYARARELWDLEADDRALVRQMVREGSKKMPERNPLEGVEYEDVLRLQERSLPDKAPILKQRSKVEGRVPDDADAADVASAIVKENMKVLDGALDSFRTQLDSYINPKSKKVELPGIERKLDLDKDFVHVPQTEGEGFRKISVREFLEEQRKTEFELEAVKTCSIR